MHVCVKRESADDIFCIFGDQYYNRKVVCNNNIVTIVSSRSISKHTIIKVK